MHSQALFVRYNATGYSNREHIADGAKLVRPKFTNPSAQARLMCAACSSTTHYITCLMILCVTLVVLGIGPRMAIGTCGAFCGPA